MAMRPGFSCCAWGHHRLFAEVLRARLQQAHPELTSVLQRRAAAWHEQNGLLADAVHYALAAADYPQAGRLLEAISMPVALNGEVQTVLGWLNALPAGLMQQNPRLALNYAVCLMFTNQLAEAEQRLQVVEQASQPDMPANQAHQIGGRVAAIRANLVRFSGDVARWVALAQQALTQLPVTELTARAPALLNAALNF
jgi:ATP/maltotriose-dependent transcriptional regulator MalT